MKAVLLTWRSPLSMQNKSLMLRSRILLSNLRLVMSELKNTWKRTFSSDYCSLFTMSLEWQTQAETVTTKTQASKWPSVGHFVIVMYEMALLHTADLQAGKHKSICRIREQWQFGSWSAVVRISRNLGNNHRFTFNYDLRHNRCIISASFNPQA